MINNQDRNALVFGVRNDASIAFEMAKKLRESGCRVFLSYVEETKDEVLFLAKEHDMQAEYARCVDVREEDHIQDFIQEVHDAFGLINYILHGVAFGSQKVLCYTLPGSKDKAPSYLDIPFEDLMDSFNTSAYSLLRICRVAETFLADNASILTLTYNASQRVFPGYAGMAINKAALENIMLYLANYFRAKSIRVNAISAGLVMTSSSGAISGVRSLRKLGKQTAPLGNVSAEDVADAGIYYFSDLSKKVTGNIHFVDGGFNIMGVPVHEE